MGISDLIASFIHEALEEAGGGFTELQRADLAQRFKCVPSQINYVISTRFSPAHGYVVESRRGGNGYIRIRRIRADPMRLIIHTINAVGEEIDQSSANAFLTNLQGAEVVSQQVAQLMAAALGEAALKHLPPDQRDVTRASIFKQMLMHAVC